MSATTWYVARSAGLVAYLLISSSVVLGVLMSAKVRLSWPRFAIEEVHRFVAILAGVFVTLHGVAMLLDKVVPFSLAQTLVPFTTSYRPLAVGLGVASAELLAAIALSNAFRKRLPYTLWRRMHYLTILVWLGATAHGLLAGTDRRDAWFIALVSIAVASVALAFTARFARAAGNGALVGVSLAAVAAVVALAFAPQPPAPHPSATTSGGVPSRYSGRLAGRVVGSQSPVVSVVGWAGGAGVRVDLLVTQGQVATTSLQLRFPNGAFCAGAVRSLGIAGLVGSCGTHSVRIAWSIAADETVSGRLDLS